MDRPAAAKTSPDSEASLNVDFRAYEDAVEALLIDRFKLTPDGIDRLTDREVYSLYFHPRDSKGVIVFPEGRAVPIVAPQGPPTAEKQLEAVLLLKAVFGDALARGSAEEAERVLRERMAQTEPKTEG